MHIVTVTTKTQTRIGQSRPAVEVECTCRQSREFASYDQSENLRAGRAWKCSNRRA